MGPTPFVNWNVFSFSRNCNYGNTVESINHKFQHDSFWDNIDHLKQLRINKFFYPSYIERQTDLLLQKAARTSSFTNLLLSEGPGSSTIVSIDK